MSTDKYSKVSWSKASINAKKINRINSTHHRVVVAFKTKKQNVPTNGNCARNYHVEVSSYSSVMQSGVFLFNNPLILTATCVSWVLFFSTVNEYLAYVSMIKVTRL